MKVIKLKSPAKINVRLEVINKKHDGYHDLRLINTLVNIYDEIECELTEKGITVECINDSSVPSGEQNIAYAVAKEILAYSNKNIGVHIRIKKNIPTDSGMGGCASNAAAILTGLNDLLKINLSKEKLMKIGIRFGADVPFFILGVPAVAKGIGDNLYKIKKMPKLPMVVISPNLYVSTKWVYDHFDAANDNEPSKEDSEEALPLQYATKKSIIKYLNNDLESVTTKKFPLINDLKKVLEKTGAMATQMTGSGPTVFGIYLNKDIAEIACKKIQAKVSDCKVFLAENIS